MKKLYCLVILFVALSCNKNANPESQTHQKFTKQEYIGKWPFSVDEVDVFCSGYKEIYCKADNGKIYALNGSAKGASSHDPSISKVEEIWLDDPQFAGLKISYSDFIAEGLKLCEDK
ncbi:DUF2511 domain-containing protein [Chryseobacterium phocaeense]|uniref:DUF2511 domain-containing protein n=1 Tax=Chryseobacterium phocaeense TaxID=1816690 RepID=UPI0009BBD5EA|nr:DUF2511 domain-containing protein [Chryseobacterium phocaeense]